MSPLRVVAQSVASSDLFDLRSGLTPGHLKEIERKAAQARNAGTRERASASPGPRPYGAALVTRGLPEGCL